MKARKHVVVASDFQNSGFRIGKDSDRSKRTPTVRKVKAAIGPLDRPARTRVETGSSAVADLGTSPQARPTLAEREKLALIDLSVELAPERGLLLSNPIMVASGTFGYGVEYGDVVDVQRLGSICC